MLKPKILKEKSEKELADLLAERREELRKFRFALTGSKTRNVKIGRDGKREIARILTFLRDNKYK